MVKGQVLARGECQEPNNRPAHPRRPSREDQPARLPEAFLTAGIQSLGPRPEGLPWGPKGPFRARRALAFAAKPRTLSCAALGCNRLCLRTTRSAFQRSIGHVEGCFDSVASPVMAAIRCCLAWMFEVSYE